LFYTQDQALFEEIENSIKNKNKSRFLVFSEYELEKKSSNLLLKRIRFINYQAGSK